ncbi:MAG TPA: UbiA family prenyltransferase, partial [Chitinivibrionales bacterium]
SATVAWATAATCAAASICAPLFVYPMLSIFSAAALLLGVVYSFPPVRFSGRCFLDFLANGTGYGIIAFGAGWYFSGADFVGFGFWLSALPYFLLMCAGSISSTLPDYDGDKKCGKNTTAVVLGVKSAHVLATSILIAALIAGAVRSDAVAMMCAGCSLPFYVFYYVKPGRRSMEATYKVGGVLCMVFAAVLVPVAALTALCVGLLTWLYFKLRHHTTYPSLVPVRHDE